MAEIDALRAKLADTQRHRDELVTENHRLNREFKRIETAERAAAEAVSTQADDKALIAALKAEVAVARADADAARASARANKNDAEAGREFKRALGRVTG